MDLGLSLDQLRELVVRPVLTELGLHSPAAETLVLGTAITESRLRYLKQIGTGPALGLWQCEPFTHSDLWRTTLYGKHLGARVSKLAVAYSGLHPPHTQLVTNLSYAAAICRVHYYRIKQPLPANEPAALARYWKQYYNTPLGAGTVEKATPHFALAMEA